MKVTRKMSRRGSKLRSFMRTDMKNGWPRRKTTEENCERYWLSYDDCVVSCMLDIESDGDSPIPVG